MFGLECFSTYIPERHCDILSLGDLTGLSHEMLQIFKVYYGLQFIPVAYDESFIDLNRKALNLLCEDFDVGNIGLVLYVHTGSIVSPVGYSVFRELRSHLFSYNCLLISMTAYKCVGYFAALKLLGNFFVSNCCSQALVLTGEIAVSKYLRVVPNTAIVGDAATVSLFSSNAKNHQLIYVDVKIVPGFSEGIFLSQEKLCVYDDAFIDRFSAFILDCVLHSGISLSDIKCILPHNVNVPTWIKISAALSIPIDTIFLECIPKFGHCFCSDQVINLKHAICDGRLKKGDHYLMAACGIGFYFGAAIFKY